MIETTHQEIEHRSEFSSEADRWAAELSAAANALRDWHRECREINKRYISEDGLNDSDMISEKYATFKYNILWSNVEVLIPAIYSQTPIPVVKRRFRDSDPKARLASEILERCLQNDLERDERMGRGLDDVLKQSTKDLLLFSRSVAWTRYEPVIGQSPEGPVFTGEYSPIDFVRYDDFLYPPKKTWSENSRTGWVARKVAMTKAAGIERFGEAFNDLSTSQNDDNETEMDKKVEKEVEVWEIWDATTKNVYWFARSDGPMILDMKHDPLKLDGFFPCPRPAFGTISTLDLKPIPDYRLYKSLSSEMDRLTKRIDRLARQLRVAGVYDASMEAIGSLLTGKNQEDDVLVAVNGMTTLMGKGSGGSTLTGIVQYLPIDQIAKTMLSLYEARDRTKQALYEVSGIADVMRGVVDPREKLGQSQMKTSNASRRVEKKRSEIEVYARKLIQLKAEIMVEHYEPVTLKMMSGFYELPQIQALPDPEKENAFMQAYQLLKDDRLRGFRVEVETNSTVMMNDTEEKQNRIEFLEAVGAYLERALPTVEQYPQMAPMIGKMLLFGVRGFRAGRQLEVDIEDFVNQISEMPPPDEEGNESEQAKVQMEQQKAQMQMQMEQQKAQTEMGLTKFKAETEAQKLMMQMQANQEEMQVRMQEMEIERQKMVNELDMLKQKAMIEAAKPREI